MIALYMRISVDDGNNDESQSIQNQRDLLYSYVQNQPDLRQMQTIEVVDDGSSGFNFERPGIKKLFAMLGHMVKCIVCKDFSRFGRNHIEVGDYLDQKLPFLGVRFISVNDGYDSNQNLGRTIGLDVSMKALVHELYSRDISQKIRQVREMQMRKGEHVCSIAFYGYLKSPTVKNKLVIDEPAARVVRRIFHMAANGLRKTKIAQILNSECVLSPLMYRKKHVDSYKVRGWRNVGSKAFWTHDNVYNIITDFRYTGCYISFGRTRIDVASKRTKIVPPDQRIVVENAHEPIISTALFYEAQTDARRKNPGLNKKTYQSSIFSGLLKCDFCNRRLVRSHSKESYYYCPTGKIALDTPCADMRVDEEVMKKISLASIHTQMRLQLKSQKMMQTCSGKDELQKQLSSYEAAMDKSRVAAEILYEDYAEGRISKDNYLSVKQKELEKENDVSLAINEIKARLQELIIAPDRTILSSEECHQYVNTDILTRETLKALIREIRVTDAQSIEIHWAFEDAFSHK